MYNKYLWSKIITKFPIVVVAGVVVALVSAVAGVGVVVVGLVVVCGFCGC